MPRTKVNDVELFYDEMGQGEPILFHHGYTGSHDVWWELIAPRLADRYRCIVMDCRGAGDSERPPAGYSFEQYALDVIGLADSLGLERFTFSGHSMGGGIGMQLAVAHPERIERLILVAPIPSGGIPDDPDLRAEQRRLREASDAFAQLLAQRLLLRVRNDSEESIARAVRRALSSSEGHFEESWTAMIDFDVAEQLGEVEIPTLIIAGAADGLLAANLRDFERLPNATLHVFSRVGHSIPSDVPDQFATVVADFLEHGVVNARTQNAKLEQHRAATGWRR